eukprot:4859589-Pyramimonas_sp.AAC.2
MCIRDSSRPNLYPLAGAARRDRAMRADCARHRSAAGPGLHPSRLAGLETNETAAAMSSARAEPVAHSCRDKGERIYP